MERKPILIALVAVLALVAGCVGVHDDGGGDASDVEGEPEEADRAADASDDAATGDAETDGDDAGETAAASAAVQDDRELIRTASLELEVVDFERTRANLTDAVRERDGHLGDSVRERHERGTETWTTGRLTYRVPAAEFEAFHAVVEAEGEVVTAEIETEDVTDRLVDLEARIANAQSQRERLREQYEGAEDTDAVLAVEDRLSAVQGEIERLEAERASLGDRVAYATVTVSLAEPDAERERATGEPGWYETPAAAALSASVGGVATALRASVVAAAYLLPYLLAGGAVVATALAFRRGVRELRSREGDADEEGRDGGE